MTGAGSLQGLRVIVTRPENEGGPLAQALSEAGAQAISLPLLRIEPVPDARLPVCDPSKFDYIVFTSANAVECFVPRLSENGLANLRCHGGVAVIGPATRSALAAHNVKATITASVYVAESLLIALGEVAGKRILWPRAESVRPVLGEGLRAADARLEELVVYRTIASVPSDAQRRIAGADAVTFTSPSGVAAWAGTLGIPSVRVVCIGPITAKAARDRGFHVDAIADSYTIDGIVAAFARALEPVAPVS